jgi:hypothetical protein
MALLSKMQSRQSKYQTANSTYSQDFINNTINSYPSIKIVSEDGNQKIAAAVVSKQESDEGYIYTPKNKPLTIGSVWLSKTLYWLVSEEIIVIKDVNWHKYHVYLCNVEIDGKHAYFYGPGKSKINVNLKQNTYLMSAQSPILIMGSDNGLEYRDKFIIKNRAWSVEEYDNITTDGITYYTLAQTTISKNTKVESLSKLTPFENIDGNQDEELRESGEISADKPIYVIPMTEVTVENFKNFADSSLVEVVKRTKSSVTFKIKHNVKECSIFTTELITDKYGLEHYKEIIYTTIKEKE